VASARADVASVTVSRNRLFPSPALCRMRLASSGPVRPRKPERFWGPGSLPRAGAVRVWMRVGMGQGGPPQSRFPITFYRW